MTKLHPIAAMLLVVAAAMPYGAAQAAPLEAEECEALKSEKKTLLTPMVQEALKRGPDWAKDHLHDYEKFVQIRRYLQVEEKVAFRCRTDGVRVPKPEPPPVPHRKPPVPVFIVAGVDASALMPERNPAREAGTAVAATTPANEGEGEGDIDGTAMDSTADDSAREAAADGDAAPDTSVSATARGLEAAARAIADDEAAIRQGLAKP